MKFPFTVLIYILAEGLTNATLVRYIPFLRTQNPLAILHWTITCICIVFHFISSFKDPGYLDSQPAQNQIDPKCQLVTSNAMTAPCQFCKICKINQQMRTKHCYSCCKCVETFDHHCPFLQNCIGQRNRPYFYIYLFSQTIHLAIIETFILTTLNSKTNYYLLALGTFIFTMIIIFGGLLIMQTAYMLLGITTWEYLCHEDIWYLRERTDWRIFSGGVFRNIRNYWSTSGENIVFKQQGIKTEVKTVC